VLSYCHTARVIAVSHPPPPAPPIPLPVGRRYRDWEAKQGGEGSATSDGPLPTGLEECTFKPRTNPVKPSAMPAAALYVQAPIFDRLSRTHTRAQREREMATLVAGAVSGGSVSGGSDGGGSGAAGGGGGWAAGSVSAEEEARYAEFYNRQVSARFV
jgi:hypothetical protein